MGITNRPWILPDEFRNLYKRSFRYFESYSLSKIIYYFSFYKKRFKIGIEIELPSWQDQKAILKNYLSEKIELDDKNLDDLFDESNRG